MTYGLQIKEYTLITNIITQHTDFDNMLIIIFGWAPLLYEVCVKLSII